MRTGPLVSFIIPVFNRKELLERCLLSILESEFKDLEIIVVDDASSDGAAGLIQHYAEAHRHIRYHIQPENRGPGAARNVGLKLARGRFIAFPDSDDQVIASALPRLAEVLAGHPQIDLLQMNYLVRTSDGRSVEKILIDQEGLFSLRDFLLSYPSLGVMPLWSTIYRADFLRDNHLSLPELYLIEDCAFYTEALSRAQRLYALPLTYYVYNAGAEGSLGNSRLVDGARLWPGLEAYCQVCERLPASVGSLRPFSLALHKVFAHMFLHLSLEDAVAAVRLAEGFSRQSGSEPDAGKHVCNSPYLVWGLWLSTFIGSLRIMSGDFEKDTYLCPCGPSLPLKMAELIKILGGRVAGFWDNRPDPGNPYTQSCLADGYPVSRPGRADESGDCRVGVLSYDIGVGLALEKQMTDLGFRTNVDLVSLC